jgi:hypothetical protein
MKKNLSNLKNESGIALVLSVLILANLIMIALVVSDVILRIGKTGHEISESEIAYFAAEGAMEKAIYEIEQNQDASDLGILASPDTGTLSSSSGTWERFVEPVFSTPITCIDDNQKITYHTVANTSAGDTLMGQQMALGNNCIYAEDYTNSAITTDNVLVVLLEAGKSFNLDLNIAPPAGIDFYPGKVFVDWTEFGGGAATPEGRLIVLDENGQEVHDTASSNEVKVPDSGQLYNDPIYRLRVTNDSSGYITYLFRPTTGDSLPLGLTVTSKGYYGERAEKERIIVVERRNWEIY